MEFNPGNKIVQRCLQGMAMEAKGNMQEASRVFLQAWNEASNDFEKFLAAHFVARHQMDTIEKLNWAKTALKFAQQVNDVAVESAYPTLYVDIAETYLELGDVEHAKLNSERASSYMDKVSDKGPFYHGTRADLQVGDLLTAGYGSNYKSGLVMNHIYFTGLANGAGLAASLARGEGPERVYIVEPTGNFEHDPNVTDKKFPGNLTRSYRSLEPLKIIGELTGWEKQTPADLQTWRDRIAKTNQSPGADIIN